MGIGAGLLVLAGLGGLALRTERRSPVHALGCAGGQLAGAPEAAADCDPEVVAAGVAD